MTSPSQEPQVTEEAARQAEEFKAQGNELLSAKDYRGAVEMYSRALELDPDNAVYWSNRSAAYLALVTSAATRCVTPSAVSRCDPIGGKDTAARAPQSTRSGALTPPEPRARGKRNCVKKPQPADPSESTEESAPKRPRVVDFGTSDGQVARLLQDHYQWINLNPFRVLMLDTHATEEDIKQHYRKISTLVHPDKCTHPRAREAFEEVKKAHETMQNEDRRQDIH
ncbi:hypothetical protein PINS_up016275 [Pythium insidiosum]|nr:hypothetical protein PINS_up016275 [Pythium insidiosum]